MKKKIHVQSFIKIYKPIDREKKYNKNKNTL